MHAHAHYHDIAPGGPPQFRKAIAAMPSDAMLDICRPSKRATNWTRSNVRTDSLQRVQFIERPPLSPAATPLRAKMCISQEPDFALSRSSLEYGSRTTGDKSDAMQSGRYEAGTFAIGEFIYPYSP
ncbi:MAG TPA: hypothetical protein VFU49_07920 [Ktedonobacteraceae bacterium]|nr:hypothetical protein [Ktedonobacteraceae bacterium]